MEMVWAICIVNKEQKLKQSQSPAKTEYVLGNKSPVLWHRQCFELELELNEINRINQLIWVYLHMPDSSILCVTYPCLDAFTVVILQRNKWFWMSEFLPTLVTAKQNSQKDLQ